MNYWAVLILTAVAMVAILVVFMWWWTTDNWDWASAELKSPRPVPHEPLKAYLDWVDWREELEQRVTALEERQTAFEISWDSQLGRDLRLKIVAEVAATPSPVPGLTPGPTASVTTPTSLKDVKAHMGQT